MEKNATFPQYVLVIVHLYLSKVYTYPVKSRQQILQKIKIFYDEVRSKRKGKRVRLQVDNEFRQAKIKDLNDENNVEMFTTSIRDGKAFAAEQKIRELKTRISKLNAQKLKISPTKIIQNSTLNMNLMKSVGFTPEETGRRSLESEHFKTVFNIHRLEKTKKLHNRLGRYDARKYSTMRKKLIKERFVGEKVLVLAKRIKKKAVPGKFYKQLVQNISYFNKDTTFITRKILPTDGIKYYRLKDAQNNRKVTKCFQRTELLAVKK